MNDIIIGDKYDFHDNSRMIKVDSVTLEALQEMMNPDKERREQKKEYADFEEVSDEQPANLVFKKFHEGKRIDFRRIRAILDEMLVSVMNNKYEWYAAYRTLFDLGLVEVMQLSKFSEQMNVWFPQAKIACTEDSLGDYATGHTSKPYRLWSIEAFKADKKKGQSETGFSTLSNHCHELMDALSPIPVISH